MAWTVVVVVETEGNEQRESVELGNGSETG